MAIVKAFLLAAIAAGAAWAKVTKPQQDPNQALYEATLRLSEAQDARCGSGACVAELRQVSCTWGNTDPVTRVNCSYSTEAEESRQLTGDAAVALFNKIEKVQTIDSDCGAGTCGYKVPQNVLCRRLSDTNSYSCKTESVQRSAPVPMPASMRPKPKTGQE